MPTTVVLTGVPVQVCPVCGEDFMSADVLRQVESIVDDAARGADEVVIREYSVACA